MSDKNLIHEDLVDEKVAAGIVASVFFVASVIAGAKIRAALFSLLAPVALVYAIPPTWRFVVRKINPKGSAANQPGCDAAACDETVTGRTQ